MPVSGQGATTAAVGTQSSASVLRGASGGHGLGETPVREPWAAQSNNSPCAGELLGGDRYGEDMGCHPLGTELPARGSP